MENFFQNSVDEAEQCEEDGFIVDPREVLKEEKKNGMPLTLIPEADIKALGHKAIRLYHSYQ